MKHHFLLSLLILTLIIACKNSPGNQASVLPRGNDQIDHLDRFEQEIQAFEAADKVSMPPKNAVLFVGSSSIRMWNSVAKDFAPAPVIQRGFGGSTLPELLYYAERIVLKYEPKVIIMYSGDNDIAEETAPAIVFQNFKKFAGMVEQKLPNTKLVYISIKPSGQRWKLWEKMQAVNFMVEKYAQNHPNIRFADIRPTLLDASGKPDQSLFQPDSLHLNEKGYAKWVEKLKPLVTELYEEPR